MDRIRMSILGYLTYKIELGQYFQCYKSIHKISAYAIIISMLGDLNELVYELNENNKLFDKFNAYEYEYELNPKLKEIKTYIYDNDFNDITKHKIEGYIYTLYNIYTRLKSL